MALLNLCAQRNSPSPIFFLPPEILQIIFIYCASNYYKKFKFCAIVPYWVNVSYVCQYWRSVALDCPALWAYHINTSLRWTEELLARSKQALLKIKIYSSKRTETWCSTVVEKLLNHSEHIQEFSLWAPATVLPKKLFLYAPHLQKLEIETWGSGDDGPEITIGDNLPLHTLKIKQCLLPWYLLNLKGITTLFIQKVPYAFQQSTVEFLSTLKHMQGLIDLHVDNALTGAHGLSSTGALDISSKISLPYLNFLSVIAPLSTVVALLSCTNIPSKAKVMLHVQTEAGSSMDDYIQFSSVLAQRLGQTVKDLPCFSPTICQLDINTDQVFKNSTRFAFSVSEHHNDEVFLSMRYPNPPEDYNSPLVDITIKAGLPIESNDVQDHVINDICHSIASMNIQGLHVVNPPFLSAFWRNLLGHLPRLRYLKLSNGCLPDFASVLSHTYEKPLWQSHLPTRYLDDHLRSLEIHNVMQTCHTFVPLLKKLELYSIHLSSSPTICQASELLDALSTRQVSCTCPQLTMNRCHKAGP